MNRTVIAFFHSFAHHANLSKNVKNADKICAVWSADEDHECAYLAIPVHSATRIGRRPHFPFINAKSI